MALSDMLIAKAKEAFVMAIEVYNKPTIRYRVEGFCFFICNAWELMLKAHIIKRGSESDIYYKDNSYRTLSLEKCIQKVDTNKNSPIRKNLETVIDLRNTSTHYIVEEYETLYVPIFQACVFNFCEKLSDYHEIDITDDISQSFLNLAITPRTLNESEIKTKYSEAIFSHLHEREKDLNKKINTNNQHFAIRIEHHILLTKDPGKANASVYIDSAATEGVAIIRELKDPNDTHKYTCKKCCKEIMRIMRKTNPDFTFNAYHFNLFCKKFGLKSDEKFCYTHRVHTQPTYSYSIHAINFIVEALQNDSEILQKLKK